MVSWQASFPEPKVTKIRKNRGDEAQTPRERCKLYYTLIVIAQAVPAILHSSTTLKLDSTESTHTRDRVNILHDLHESVVQCDFQPLISRAWAEYTLDLVVPDCKM